jgi:hypothetical protein
MINVAVKQGWAGGKWHTRQFEDALKAAGYKITDELNADVVIAHSVACYDLKIKSPATYFILIDPPYWPKKHILLRFFEKQRQDILTLNRIYGQKYVIKKVLWGMLYAVAKLQYTILALKMADNLSFLDELKDKNVLIIRNQQDKICSADIKVALTAYPDFYYWELPGEHDDYYTNPKPYIDLLPKTL